MPNYSRGDVILVPYPFSDLSSTKVRPAIVVSRAYPSNDVIVVPLTSRAANLLPGEFVLQDWRGAGLNVMSAVKRGLFLTDTNIIQYLEITFHKGKPFAAYFYLSGNPGEKSVRSGLIHIVKNNFSHLPCA